MALLVVVVVLFLLNTSSLLFFLLCFLFPLFVSNTLFLSLFNYPADNFDVNMSQPQRLKIGYYLPPSIKKRSVNQDVLKHLRFESFSYDLPSHSFIYLLSFLSEQADVFEIETLSDVPDISSFDCIFHKVTAEINSYDESVHQAGEAFHVWH